MKAKAVRLHGANDLRLDEFELPEIKDDEILVKSCNRISVCMFNLQMCYSWYETQTCS